MRKFKTFFSISMLCVIMVSCNPDFVPESTDIRGHMQFRSVELRIENPHNYSRVDGFGRFNQPLGSDLIIFFNEVFDKHNPFDIPAFRNQASITVTANHAYVQANTMRYTYSAPNQHGLASNRLRSRFWWQVGNNDANAAQTIEVLVRSGQFRHYRGYTGRFTWTWIRNGEYFGGTLSGMIRSGVTLEMIETGVSPVPAGNMRTTGRFVRIIPPSNNNNNNNNNNVLCVCGALHNRPSPPPGQSFPPCDCMVLQPVDRLPLLPPDFRFQYKLEDSRFTEVAQVEDTPDWFRTPNTVVMMPIQTNTNSGELRVYATAETYRQLVSR